MFPSRVASSAAPDGYAALVLRDMRDATGGPNLRVRFAALLVVLALVVATAPLVVVPLVHVLARAGIGW